MIGLTFDELKEKQVININDCKILGYITDANLDVSCGRILSVTVRDCKGILPFGGNEITIPYENITKIGDDIIFVNVVNCSLPPPPQAEPPKKRFFS